MNQKTIKIIHYLFAICAVVSAIGVTIMLIMGDHPGMDEYFTAIGATIMAIVTGTKKDEPPAA